VWVGELLGRVLSDIIINIYNMKMQNSNTDYCKVTFDGYDKWINPRHLATPTEKTWETLEVGDKVQNRLGIRTILAKVQNRYMVSNSEDNNVSELTFTEKDFLDCGYEIVQPEQEKSWFINSRGEVTKSGNVKSSKHMKRIAWGNAFASRERAQEAAEMIKLVTHVLGGNIDSI